MRISYLLAFSLSGSAALAIAGHASHVQEELTEVAEGTSSDHLMGEVPYAISWSSIDSGGILKSTGGHYSASGTMGQPDAGAMTGSGFELTGGFWAIPEIRPGDCDQDGDIDLPDYHNLYTCFAGPDRPVGLACLCFDLDDDDDVDMEDAAKFLANY